MKFEQTSLYKACKGSPEQGKIAHWFEYELEDYLKDCPELIISQQCMEYALKTGNGAMYDIAKQVEEREWDEYEKYCRENPNLIID